MANSDNVLRGGLTKHIDVPELLKHTIFEGIFRLFSGQVKTMNFQNLISG